MAGVLDAPRGADRSKPPSAPALRLSSLVEAY